MNRGTTVLVQQIHDDYLVAIRTPPDMFPPVVLGRAHRDGRRWAVVTAGGGIIRRVWRRSTAARLLERLARDSLIRHAIGAARLDSYRPDLEDRMARDRRWRI